MTALYNLSSDVLRSTLSLVDFESLVRLYATLNKSMQTKLATPGLISQVSLAPSKKISPSLIRLFAGSLRDVEMVFFFLSQKSSLRFISLLPTLNPRVLSTVFFPVDSGALHAVFDEARGHNSEEMSQTAQLLSPNGFPNLLRLTPRLETATFDNKFYDYLDLFTSSYANKMEQDGRWHEYELPPTLNSLTLSLTAPFHSRMVESFPKALTLLSLFGVESAEISPIFENLPVLETLKVNYMRSLTLKEGVALPKSLHTLAITSNSSAPVRLLKHPSLSLSSLLEFKLTSAASSDCSKTHAVDLAECMPPTLQTLFIRFWPPELDAPAPEDKIIYTRLPPSVTDMQLIIDNSLGPALLSIPDLKALTSITVICGGESHLTMIRPGEKGLEALQRYNSTSSLESMMTTPLSIEQLPSTVTKLVVASGPTLALTKAEIQLLPIGLKELHVNYFQLSRLKTLRKRAPACALTIYEGINFWCDDNGEWIREKFANLFTDVFDCNVYVQEVSRYFSDRNVRLNIFADNKTSVDIKMELAADLNFITKFVQTNVLLPAGKVNFNPQVLVSNKFLKKLPNLTHVSIDAPGVTTIKPRKLPASLTRLDLGNTHSLRYHRLRDFPANITHLTATYEAEVERSSVKNVKMTLDVPNWYISPDVLEILKKQGCKILNYSKNPVQEES